MTDEFRGFTNTPGLAPPTRYAIVDDILRAVIDGLSGITPQRFGAVGDGVTDDTAAIKKWLETGGDLWVPDGTYLIAAAGPDAGGVHATITKSFRVICASGAKFVAGQNLDNDMIRIVVPPNGPPEKLSVEWYGGLFDQRLQRNSTVIPYSDEYPGANPGTSATCDALSLRGSYTAGGAPINGFYRVVVDKVTFYAGDHWQTAGGDSGVFVDGSLQVVFDGIVGQGCRDLCIYGSRDSTGVAECEITIRNCAFYSCFGGAAVKRSASFFKMYGNYADNCVVALQVNKVAGAGARGGLIFGNTTRYCHVSYRVDEAQGVIVESGVVVGVGARLANQSAVEAYIPCGVWLAGATKCRVLGGEFIDRSNAFASYSGIYGVRLSHPIGETTDSTYNSVYGVRCHSGYDGCVDEVSGEGDYNGFHDCYAYGAGAVHPIKTGANTFVQRTDGIGRPDFDRLAAGDGTASLTSVQRRNWPNSGMWFGENIIGFSIVGNEIMRLTNQGVQITELPTSASGLAAGTLWNDAGTVKVA